MFSYYSSNKVTESGDWLKTSRITSDGVARPGSLTESRRSRASGILESSNPCSLASLLTPPPPSSPSVPPSAPASYSPLVLAMDTRTVVADTVQVPCVQPSSVT